MTAPARYFGSLTDYHGDVVFIDDCDCTHCLPLDPWDRHRFKLTIALPGRRLAVLGHVRSESFTGTRGLDDVRNVGATERAA